MPTSATHITLLERVASANPTMMALLGDPHALPTSPAGAQIRYAKLGALGPDIFYAMADYGGELQDLENFLVKVAGSFGCIGELMGEVQRYVGGLESVITLGVSDSIHQTFDLITATLNEGLMALVVGPAGMNFWPVFEAARQRDLPRENWYWADYLHYIKSGKFVHRLIDNARSMNNPNLLAYAYGYLTHYVTDVVGHPYVNQVVEGPWRLYWQRHHLVENYMDAYVWDRWHTSNPAPPPPSIAEPPLDSLVATPNVTGMGAPVTFARLNDHVNVGDAALPDPVDKLVSDICDKIRKGLFDVGIAEVIEPPDPASADFDDWCKLVSSTIREVYDNSNGQRVAENLANSLVTGGPARPDGYPTPDDVAGSYGVFRLILRISTEEKISEPQPPNIVSDITAAVNQLLTDLQNDINAFPPPPNINTSGSFSWDSLWNAIKQMAEYVAKTLEAVGKTVFDFITNSINTAGTIVSDAIKYALYLLNKALFSIYSAFRDVLVQAAYALPFTNRLSVDLGGGHNSEMLWRSSGNVKKRFPVEEIGEERTKFFTSYSPATPPHEQAASNMPGNAGLFLELPSFDFVAPYVVAARAPLLTPDVFLDGPLGPDDMFKVTGPQAAVRRSAPPAIAVVAKNFGGALANSIKGITLAEAGFPGDATLPDYNLDGDRSYAWPCWDVTSPEPRTPPTSVFAASHVPVTATPLRPEATVNDAPDTHRALTSVTPVNA